MPLPYYLCQSRADWIDEKKKLAIQQLRDFLASPEITNRLEVYGLEPARSEQAPILSSRALEFLLSSWNAVKNPLSLSLVVDLSASMDGQALRAVQASLRNLIEELEGSQQVSLVQFAHKAERVSALSAEHAKILRAIDTFQAKGGSAL